LLEPIPKNVGLLMQGMFAFLDVVQSLRGFSIANHVDLIILLSTIVAYYILQSLRPRKHDDCAKQQDDIDFQQAVSDPGIALRAASEAVAACWNACNEALAVQFSKVVTAMRACKKEDQSIANELLHHFQENPKKCSMSAINDILDSLGKQLDTELARRVVAILPRLQLALNHNSYEILIGMHVKAGQHSEAQRMLAEMKANDLPLSTRIVFFALKVALNMSDYAGALQHYRTLKAAWQESGATEALLPKIVMLHLMRLACKEGQLGALLPELEGIPLLAEAIGSLAMDSVTADALLVAARNCGRADIVEHLELLAKNSNEGARCPLPLKKCALRVQRLTVAAYDMFCAMNAVIGKWVVLVF